MSQVLDTGGVRPPVSRRIAAHTAVAAARLIALLPPRRIRTALHLARRGARPARYDEALRARQHVTAVSTLCADRYCLQRSLATGLAHMAKSVTDARVMLPFTIASCSAEPMINEPAYRRGRACRPGTSSPEPIVSFRAPFSGSWPVGPAAGP
ncbi:lasso peptide biosynthesis B2 protein [Streptomyces sp. NPDC056948]|uniref:lasso peptide biosynthesis B2 protein n=1 Tax=Streptomyces sp. NPDC056948 TaxID=3345975 RepID=UPI00363C7999